MSTTQRTREWYEDLNNVTDLVRWMADEGRVYSIQDGIDVYEKPHKYSTDWHDYQTALRLERTA